MFPESLDVGGGHWLDVSTVLSVSVSTFSLVGIGVIGRCYALLSLAVGVPAMNLNEFLLSIHIFFAPFDWMGKFLCLALVERDFFLFLDGSYAAVQSLC